MLQAFGNGPTGRSALRVKNRPLGILLSVSLCAGALAAETNHISTNHPAARSDATGRAQKIFEEARAKFLADTNNAASAWELGRACFDLAEPAANNATKANFAEQGIAACRQAIAINSNLAPAHYYLGMNIGQVADTKRNLAGLKMVKEMEREFNIARQLDEHFDFAGPDRNLGLLYFEAPSFVSIGSRTKARQHLKRAVELAPEFPENRLNLIEPLLKWGNHTEARAELKALEQLWPEAKKKFAGEAWMSAWPIWEKRLDSAKKTLAGSSK